MVTQRVLLRPLVALLLVAAMTLTALPAGLVPTASAAAALQLSQTTAGGGDSVAVTGTGFHPGDGVIVRAEFSAPDGVHRVQAPASVDGAGTFHTSFTVPEGAQPQIYTVTAQDFHNDLASQKLQILRVITVNPATSAKTFPVRAGHKFLVRGAGFPAGEVIHLSATFKLYNGNAFTANKVVQVDTHGSFKDVLMGVPASAKPGVVVLEAKVTRGNTKASANVNVIYQPSISLSAPSVRPGSDITVLGRGFVPGAAVQVSVTVRRSDSTTVTLTRQANADGNGDFSIALPVPASTTPGSYTVTAIGSVSNFHASVALKVAVQASISVDPASVYPGGTVSIKGSGYSANVPVTVTASIPVYGGGTRTATLNVHTDGNGTFVEKLLVPTNAAAGAITVSAKGPHTQASAHVEVKHLTSSVSVSPAVVIPGSSVTIHGSGYLAGDKVSIQVRVTLTNGSTTTLTTTATTDTHGQFSAMLQIPANVLAGQYPVIARSTMSGRAPTTQLAVARLSSHLTVSPNAVLPGQAVTVTGGGFSAGATVNISAVFPLYGGGSRTVTAAARTNGNGQFSVELSVPTNAAAQQVVVTAQGPNTRTAGQLLIRHLNATVQTSSSVASPGTTITLTGSGYLGSDRVEISVTVKLSDGSSKTVVASAVTDRGGHFTAQIAIPANAAGGTYTIVARSTATGRAPTAHLTVAQLTPSIVAVPTSTAPGTPVTVNGFGYAPGQTVSISLNGQKVTTVTTSAAGKFTASVTVPSGTATGTYTITAVSAAGRSSSLRLTVQRHVSTHFYFASFYTGRGYHEYLNMLNPTDTQAQVTISYQPTNGAIRTMNLTIAAHTRITRDVNGDLGAHVSAGAVVSADVPIAVERLVYHNSDFTGGAGATSPSTTWYFANGNTSRHYREYLAIENPNAGPVQVAIRFLPTHHRAFTLYRTVGATSRTTVKVNTYVHNDAVGATITSNGPVVINRTMYIRHGITSKIGVKAPQRTWYFAGGPTAVSAHHWIGAINPSGHPVSITVRTYGVDGQALGTVRSTLKAFGRVGYLVNRIAHQTNAAVVLTASDPIVAEQTTYVGKMHDASTDTFGVYAPARTWQFATANTTPGHADTLTLFNPALTPIPVVVQFITSTGKVSQQTYVVGPLSQHRIDVGTVVPNATLGLVVASNNPLVALNRASANNRLAAMTSAGIRP